MWDELKKHPWWSTPVKNILDLENKDKKPYTSSEISKQGVSQGGAGPFSFENLKL